MDTLKKSTEREAAERSGGELEARLEDLRRKNDALERELGPFQVLADSIPDHVFLKDGEGRFVWANLNLLKAHGFSERSQIIGKTVFDINPSERAHAYAEDDRRVLSTGESLYNKLESNAYADGRTMWILTTKIPLRDGRGQIVGLCGISKDVTAQMDTERALALESNLLNTLMQNIPDAIYFKDTESRFVRVSKAIHLEGLRKLEDAIGKTDFDFFTQEHAQQAFDDEREIIRTGVPVIDKVEKETFANRPDAWVSTTKVPIRDKDGNVAGIAGISRDVTERFTAQEVVRKAKDELEIRVRERTAALVEEIGEHQRKERQLQFLNSAAHRLAHFSHRDELLPALLEVFRQSFPGMEASLCEIEAGGYVCAVSTPGLDDRELRDACTRALAAHGQFPLVFPVLIPDRRSDGRLAGLFPARPELEKLHVYAALPLQAEDRSLAVIQILAPETFLPWYEREKGVLNTLAAQAAVSLSNANNFRELEKQARMEGEMQAARVIQRRFTPQHNPSIPGVALKGLYLPAYEVGGDYLDYFQTDAGDWVIAIADVSGKGVPAALVMTMLRSAFRALARRENSARNLLAAVNDILIKDMDDRSFVTALCLILSSDGRSMSYARAGHPPLLFQPGSGAAAPQAVNVKGMALGMADGELFASRLEEKIIALNPGDRFLICTDGVLEASNPDRELYGTQRLIDVLGDRRETPEATLKLILDDVRAFTRNAPNQDDLTMLAMEVTG